MDQRRNQCILILTIGLLSIIGFSYLVAFDLVWYFGLIKPVSMIPAFIGVVIVTIAISSIVLYQRLRLNERKIFSPRDASKSKLIMIVLILFSILMFAASFQPIFDLNDVNNLPNNDSEQVYWNNMTTGHRILRMTGVEDVTSDDIVQVLFWFNTSYLENVTSVIAVYFNGTHLGDTPGDKTQDNGFPTWSWWTTTGRQYYSTDFGNGSESEMYYQVLEIPAQRANTTVEYRIALRMENGTYFDYFTYFDGNYTVLYSPTENAYNENLIQTSHFYLGVVGFAIVVNNEVLKTFYKKEVDNSDYRKVAEGLGLLDSQGNGDTFPTTRDIVSRSDKLEAEKNTIRVMSGVFMGLCIGFFLYINSASIFAIPLNFTRFLLMFSILCCLGCLVLSLSYIKIEDKGIVLKDSLLPPTKSMDDYHFLILLKIKRQEWLADTMRQLLQYGVLLIACGLSADIVTVFLRPWDIMFDVLITSYIFGFSVLFVATSIILSIISIAKNFGYAQDVLNLEG